MKYFPDIITSLDSYWKDNGCVVMQPSPFPVGAGTLHHLTVRKCFSKDNVKYCYTQPCMRPADGRDGDSPNRLLHYFQYQVILKPSPKDPQELYIKSLEAIGITPNKHDIRFVHDDWENPSIGASGVGWEIWCDGMEVSQFTYMQKIGGISLEETACEITYGLERLATYIQDKSSISEIEMNSYEKYGHTYDEQENELFSFVREGLDAETLEYTFNKYEEGAERLIKLEEPRPLAAYFCCLHAVNAFNILEAKGILSQTQRDNYIARTRKMTYNSCKIWKENLANTS